MPIWIQRIENAAIATLAVVAFTQRGYAWWWLAVLFLVFDLSMVGYAANPRVGAWVYNSVHNFVPPATLGVVGIVGDHDWAAFLGLVWAFHIAVDRFFGYGLKFTNEFTHTHLGDIGASTPQSPRRGG